MSKRSDASHEKTSQSPMHALAGQFGDAYQKLLQTSHQAALRGQKQLEEAYSELAREISAIQSDISKRQAEADQQYCKIAHEAASGEGNQQKVEQAYRDFIDTLRGLEEDALRRGNEANTKFLSQTQDSAAESQQAAQENYLNYLRSIQQAWAGLDINSLA